MDLNNIIRSAALVVIGLPLTGAVFLGVSDTVNETVAERNISRLKAELTIPCVQWASAKPDSGLENSAEVAIRDVMGDKGVDYKGLCNWVL